MLKSLLLLKALKQKQQRNFKGKIKLSKFFELFLETNPFT